MAATHGKQATLYMGSLPLTAYFNKVSTAGQVDTAEASTFGDDDKIYVTGLGDATISGEGIYDTSGVGAERDLNAVLGSSTKQVVSVYHAGDTLGNRGVGMQADTTSVEVSADIGDVVMVSMEAQSSDGYQPIVSHSAFGTASTAGTATAIDNAVDTVYGAIGYLHVTELSGSMAFVLQHSDDNVTYTTLVNFGTITAPMGTRVAVTGTVEQYTRLVRTPASTGTAAFVCGLARKNR